jgi:hypothetical protein
MADHMTAEQLRADFDRIADALGDDGWHAAIAHTRRTDLSDRLRTLAARLSGMAADTWQPIETAPKDGRLIWAFNTHDATRAPWQYECMWNGIEWYHGLGDAWPRRPPTHWRELPAAPEPPHV